MTTMSTGKQWTTKMLAMGAALSLTLVAGANASAQDSTVTAQTLVDRAQISDLITRYYYNLGHGSADSFTSFYAPDAELVLGPNSYKGRDGIENAYKAAGQNSPSRDVFSFNVLLSNPLIVTHGDSATAQLIFTEVVIDKQGAPPRLLTQGREFDQLVKVDGQWRFKKRQIMPGAQTPQGWTG